MTGRRMYTPVFSTATERWFFVALSVAAALLAVTMTALGRDYPWGLLAMTFVTTVGTTGVAVLDTVGLWAERKASDAWEDGFERGREVGPRR